MSNLKMCLARYHKYVHPVSNFKSIAQDIINVNRSSCEVTLFLSYMKENRIFSTNFRKILRCQFSSGSQVVHLNGHTDRWTDGHDVAHSYILQFCEQT